MKKSSMNLGAPAHVVPVVLIDDDAHVETIETGEPHDMGDIIDHGGKKWKVTEGVPNSHSLFALIARRDKKEN